MIKLKHTHTHTHNASDENLQFPPQSLATYNKSISHIYCSHAVA